MPLYPNSIAATTFDFITEADPNAFSHVEYLGFLPREMPGSKPPGRTGLMQMAYVFKAHFTDSTIELWMDEDYGSEAAARVDVDKYTPRLGRLPSLYRQNLHHIVGQMGDGTFFAESVGHFFVIYSVKADLRIANNDLEESFFHEATHACIQQAGNGKGFNHLASPEWAAAKAADNAFITDYAATNAQEDFAESALFAYTLIHHPERFPELDRARIAAWIPNRIAFFRTVFDGPPAPVTISGTAFELLKALLAEALLLVDG